MFGVDWHPPHFDPGYSWNGLSQKCIESLLRDKIRFVNHSSYEVCCCFIHLERWYAPCNVEHYEEIWFIGNLN